MTEMTRQERDINVANSFRREEIKVHVSLTSGIFYNGIITRVYEEFFVILDAVHGATNVFYFQLKKPLEEFEEVGG